MIPPLTLPDSRHEAFAFHIASGLPLTLAYTEAGFSPNNARARAHELLQNPDIADRIGHLKFSLPHSEELKDRYAPSLLLMPQTQEEMLAWLWQVMNGSRKILPIQMRAATLFARMNGWHLAKPPPSAPKEASVPNPAPKPKPVPLIDEERQALASLNDLTLKNDIASLTCIQEDLINYHSQMADLAFIADVTHPQDRPIQSPSPAFYVTEDSEPEPEVSALSVPPLAPSPTPPAASPAPTSPIPTAKPLESPSQHPDPQPANPQNPRMGKNSNFLPKTNLPSGPDPREASRNAVAKKPGPPGFGDTAPIRPLTLIHKKISRPPQNKRPPVPLQTY